MSQIEIANVAKRQHVRCLDIGSTLLDAMECHTAAAARAPIQQANAMCRAYQVERHAPAFSKVRYLVGAQTSRAILQPESQALSMVHLEDEYPG